MVGNQSEVIKESPKVELVAWQFFGLFSKLGFQHQLLTSA